MKEVEFELARQEQYSRKASVRIFGVDENEGENVEALCIQALKEEIDVDITDRDIDIVHRVGRRRGDKKARPILLKCMSHKTKSEIRRKKKRPRTSRYMKIWHKVSRECWMTSSLTRKIWVSRMFGPWTVRLNLNIVVVIELILLALIKIFCN